jgi:uncharacterized RDD family membrane protein YckC
MENIAIQTSQNIAIEQTLASVGERIVAAAIDFAFYAVYFSVMAIVGGIGRSYVLVFFLMVPILFYHLVCEAAMNGQSWGKKIMKIKVVKIDGSQATFSSFFIRWIFRIVDVTLFFGAISTIVIILNGKGQRLGDIVANTTVIRLKEKYFKDTIYTTIPENYIQVFEQVTKLSDSDIYTAREVLDFLNEARSFEAMQMADKTKKALEEKMGIQSDMQSRKFLNTLISDYNYIHSR